MLEVTIQVRIDFNSDTKEEKSKALIDAGKMAAKHLFTTAMLLQDKREPQMAMWTDDVFIGREEIDLAEDIDPVENTEG